MSKLDSYRRKDLYGSQPPYDTDRAALIQMMYSGDDGKNEYRGHLALPSALDRKMMKRYHI